MANTTWNPSDKSANVTLTGSNLIVTATSSTRGGVRAVDRQVSGKFYLEYTCNTIVGGNTATGFANPSVAVATTFTAMPGTLGIVNSGLFVVEGTNAFTTTPFSSGAVICYAIDLTARLVWVRVGAAGNWNNSAANNPATAVGGLAIYGLGQGIPAHPFAILQNNADQITANFGDTAFSGAVPSGFISGFTAGATINTNALATQVAAEHWLTTNPDARVTQVALEHWATVTGTGLQAVVTQVALEHWASVANVPVSVGAPMITMIG